MRPNRIARDCPLGLGRGSSGSVALPRKRYRCIVVVVATTTNTGATEALRTLGFSETDARVYAFLLQNEPSTGYRISHAIGKPTANTYKSIASLERMGAVQVEEGGNRLVRAIPPRELLAQLDRGFRNRKKKAEAALFELSRAGEDDRLYALRSVEQVLERARSMIRRARCVIVADLFPGVLPELEKDLGRAARRGVAVAIRSYATGDGSAAVERPGAGNAAAVSSDGIDRPLLPGVAVFTSPLAQQVLDAWPGQQITLVVDAEEHLLGLFDRDMTSVHQAVWSRSTFLSCMHHNHVAMEIMSTAWESGHFRSLAEAERNLGEVGRISLLRLKPPGLRRLQARFTRSSIETGGSSNVPASNPVRLGKEVRP
jgi:HTH-type transcriptional regulator, sugar sensing transcriptional regulator